MPRNADILLFLILVHAIGLYFFCSGFLLTRVELNHFSEPTEPPRATAQCTEKFIELGTNYSSWLPKQYSRIVLFIVDALRFDFVAGPMNRKQEAFPVFGGEIPILKQLIAEKPEHSQLFKFVADPPTTTSQRLKALTTGGLPTFVDAGKNFDSDEIVEDNLIQQLVTHGGKKVVALGDDTWKHLFPFKNNTMSTEQLPFFLRSRLFPSFNVWDLHTLDNGVLRYLAAELNYTGATDLEKVYGLYPEDEIFGRTHSFERWDVLIAHFLGVDHAGHRHGIYHEEMNKKLRQMNQVINDTIQNLPNDTMLFIFGDHGMNENGDHGGNSDEEVDSALFVFHPTIKLKPKRISTALDNVAPQDLTHHIPYRTIYQIDLVPTLSLLLGVPIPFGNLGGIIPELLVNTNFTTYCQSNEQAHSLLQVAVALHLNIHQIYRYVEEYSKIDPNFIEPVELLSLAQRVKVIDTQLVETPEICNTELLQLVARSYQELLAQISQLCRERWAQFDIPLMILGVTFLASGSITCIIFIVQKQVHLSMFARYFINLANFSSIVLLAAVSIRIAAGVIFLSANVMKIMEVATVIFIMVSVLLIIIYSLIFIKSRKPSSNNLGSSIEYFLPIVIAFLYAAFNQSNSFIVYEDRITFFLLTTCGLMIFTNSISKNNFSWKKMCAWIIYFLCIRLSRLGVRYRLHGTHHIANQSSTTLNNTENILHTILQLGAWIMLHAQHSFIDSPQRWLTAILLPAIYFMINLFWNLKDGILGQNLVLIEITPLLILWIPRVIYITVLVVTMLFIWKRLHSRNNVPLFQLIFTIWTPVLLLLKGQSFMFIFTCMIVQYMCFFHLFKEAPIGISLLNSWLIGLQYFFATGQQNTLNTIQWQSAFVGLDHAHIFLSGILITITVFSTKIMSSIVTVPLLPKKEKKKKDNNDITTDNNYRFTHTLVYLMFISVTLIAAVVCVFIQRRHLMVWAIFVPKFLFDASAFLVLSVCLLLGYMM